MFKRIFAFTFLILIAFSCNYAENYVFNNKTYVIDPIRSIEFKNNTFLYEDAGSPENTINGVYSVSFENDYLIIKLKRYTFIIFYLENTILLYDKFNKRVISGSEPHGAYMGTHLLYFDNITSSSFLKEELGGNEIQYKPENLTNYDITKPWVVPDVGIDEYLIIDNSDSFDELIIANGFFDPDNLGLYNKNNRIKQVLVKSENPAFEKIYNLKDNYNLQKIEFPVRTRKVKITIKDIYKGTKYNDTCLAGIFYFIDFENITGD